MKDKILIVYHYVAHYREAVFNYLCKKDSTSPYEYFIAAGELSNIPSIKLIDLERYPDISRNWVGLKNFWITKDVLWQKGLLKEIIRGKYKAIIFLGNMYFISTWIACFLCKMLRIKIYMWTHGLKYNEMGLRWLFRKFFYMLSDGLFLYGVRAKNILEAKGMNKKKLHIIYNSLDFEKQKKLYNDLIDKKKASFQKTASSKFERIIIYVGRITRDKKLDKAVLILSELNRYNFFQFKETFAKKNRTSRF